MTSGAAGACLRVKMVVKRVYLVVEGLISVVKGNGNYYEGQTS